MSCLEDALETVMVGVGESCKVNCSCGGNCNSGQKCKTPNKCSEVKCGDCSSGQCEKCYYYHSKFLTFIATILGGIIMAICFGLIVVFITVGWNFDTLYQYMDFSKSAFKSHSASP